VDTGVRSEENANYTELPELENNQMPMELKDIPVVENFDWQCLKNDVMRAPQFSSIFALMVGMGC
jgi:hypothetical protein